MNDLSTYNFIIYYQKGTLNSKADALSQCSEYHLEKGGSNRTPQSFFRPGQFRELPKIIISSVRIAALTKTSHLVKELLNKVRQLTAQDDEYMSIMWSVSSQETDKIDKHLFISEELP